MIKQKFIYKEQGIHYNDILIFLCVIFLNIALLIASVIIISEQYSDLITDIVITILMFIFNVPVIIHFVIKAIKMLMFRNKVKYYKNNGKMFRAKIVDEYLGKPLYKSEMNTVNVYHPVVEFYDSNVQREVTLISEFPLCASYKKALMSNMVTIYVVGNNFIITDYTSADSKEKSIERRTISSNNEADKLEKIEKEIQYIYAIGALIVCLLTLGLKFLFSYFAREHFFKF